MSRTLRGISQLPPLRIDTDAPDSDERSSKKVRWNSDGLMDVGEEGDSEESSHDNKVGSPVYSCQASLDTRVSLTCSQICLAATYLA
jgi:hypothetical protein